MKITLNNIDDIFKSKISNHEILTLKGYTEIETLFCDSSGFGTSNEPALTKDQLLLKVKRLVEKHGTLHAFITSVGQFQVYITLYKKDRKSTIQKLALNTYKITTLTGYKIKYYNTDIVEYKDGAYILNSGGYYTKTTKDRINNAIPPIYYINQKNGAWYINNRTTGEKIEFKDNIIIK
jgi:hypothetical protein